MYKNSVTGGISYWKIEFEEKKKIADTHVNSSLFHDFLQNPSDKNHEKTYYTNKNPALSNIEQ